MAPKKASKTTAPKKAAVVDDRKDISNMITQAKSTSASADQKAMLQLYQSYPRFDERKKDILAKWKNDKTCSWVSEYSETSTKSHEMEKTSLHGWGTMFTSKLHMNLYARCAPIFSTVSQQVHI